ncbi:MAG: AAA family ATPase [Caldilineaceae bacterium]
MSSLDRAVISPVLVGRTREVELLEMVLHTVQQGAGQMLLLAGEAGVGKSRLAAELHRQAALKHWAILAGNCFERDAFFPYAPIVDALRALIGPLPGAAVADLCGPPAVELVKLLPELALVLSDLHPTPVLDPEAEKRRLFEALLHFLSRLTQSPHAAPLLLIVEDLHWSDETTLDFLHLLARRLPTLPILLLATYRSEEITPTLRRWLLQLDRARLSRTMALEALPPQDVQTLLQAIFALKQPVRAEFLEPLYTLTEGNPFFIEEVLKVLVAAGELFYADDGWTRKSMQELHIPPSVQDAVLRRTQQLRPDARHLLTLAAVIGRRFAFGLLQQVAGHAEADLLTLIKELVAAQLVVEESAERFAFRHALTRQAVYSNLLGRERQILHRTIGAAIEHSAGGAQDGPVGANALAQVAELAYHFYEAGEWHKALRYAQQAGEQAQTSALRAAALEQFTRANGQATAGLSHPSPLHRRRGLAYETVGDLERAHRSDYRLELAQTAADRHGEWQLLLDLGQLWAAQLCANGRSFAAGFDAGKHAGRTGSGRCPAGFQPPGALAHTLNRLGNWHLNVGQPQEAFMLPSRGVDHFSGIERCARAGTDLRICWPDDLSWRQPRARRALSPAGDCAVSTVAERQSLASSLTTLAICGSRLFDG